MSKGFSQVSLKDKTKSRLDGFKNGSSYDDAVNRLMDKVLDENEQINKAFSEVERIYVSHYANEPPNNLPRQLRDSFKKALKDTRANKVLHNILYDFFMKIGSE